MRKSEIPWIRQKWGVLSASFGALLWFVAPELPGSALGFGSIEHVFLSMPLVLAPLALALLFDMLEADGTLAHWSHSFVRKLQPLAAALVVASFTLAPGRLAGACALGWLGTACLVAGGVLARLWSRKRKRGSHVSMVAAAVFLVVGAGWLVLARLGEAPRGFAPLTVFLAALHFHFSGFAFQILVAATGRCLAEFRSGLCWLQPYLALTAIAALLLIAAGNLGGVPALKFAGVMCMVLAALALARTSLSVASQARSAAARQLLRLSAASATAGMLLACVYGVGELVGNVWIGIPRMVTSHGLVNAVGFTGCGLAGHLCWTLTAEKAGAL